jgi:hypothetical protein
MGLSVCGIVGILSTDDFVLSDARQREAFGSDCGVFGDDVQLRSTFEGGSAMRCSRYVPVFAALLLSLIWALPVTAAGRLPTLPREAVAKLDLQFYLLSSNPAGPPPPPPPPPPAAASGKPTAPSVQSPLPGKPRLAAPCPLSQPIPAGYKALEANNRWYIVKAKPALAADDILRLDWSPWTQFTSEDGPLGGGPGIIIVFRPEVMKAKLAGRQDGMVLATSGGKVVSWPRVLREPAETDLSFSELPREKQAALLPLLKGLPGSEGLPITYTNGRQWVRPLPGLARIEVTARFADGSKSETLYCQRFEPWLNKGTGVYGMVVPTVLRGDSEFTVINITPGTWRYVMVGDDFAMEKSCWTVLDIKAGDDLKLDVALHRGATVSGRVVRAEDGQPVARASIFGTARVMSTDENGRYVLQHVPTDQPKVMVREGDYVPQLVEFAGVKDGEPFTAPDIKLQRGGLIFGRVPLQPEMSPDLRWYGYVAPEMGEAEQYLYRSMIEGDDHRFRVGPVPAGTYTLKAMVLTPDLDSGDRRQRWEGSIENVRVEAGQELKDLEIPVTAAKAR